MKKTRPAGNPLFFGLNKGGHDASICLIEESRSGPVIEIYLEERLSRMKYAGWPASASMRALAGRAREDSRVAESSYFLPPDLAENVFDQKVPYFDTLAGLGLSRFSRRENPSLGFLPHHYCHAMAAVEMTPFERSIIVVLDGAGSSPEAFPPKHPELRDFTVPKNPIGIPGAVAEACTVYLQEGKGLHCVHKDWQVFEHVDDDFFGDGLGMFYEAVTKYIFGTAREAGKTMGLAPLGKARKLLERMQFVRELDWSQAFRKKGKKEWEQAFPSSDFASIAATAQAHFEEALIGLLRTLREKHESFGNLILTGGCALNCVANTKILESGLFDRVYVPPFPGDESISLGLASHLRYADAQREWRPRTAHQQSACFGPLSSVPTDARIEKAFAKHRGHKPADLCAFTAELLAKGKIIAWFQGRSESGPRALGNRSILANPGRLGLKDHLNAHVKNRESFRPYGSSCTFEKSHEYFELEPGFEGPFMSFTPRVRARWRDALREVTHVDGTSRVQTVREEQNPLFHRLLVEFGKLSGFECLLNTSLNVMGEPIAETVEDAARFFELTPVDGIIVGEYYFEGPTTSATATR